MVLLASTVWGRPTMRRTWKPISWTSWIASSRVATKHRQCVGHIFRRRMVRVGRSASRPLKGRRAALLILHMADSLGVGQPDPGRSYAIGKALGRPPDRGVAAASLGGGTVHEDHRLLPFGLATARSRFSLPHMFGRRSRSALGHFPDSSRTSPEVREGPRTDIACPRLTKPKTPARGTLPGSSDALQRRREGSGARGSACAALTTLRPALPKSVSNCSLRWVGGGLWIS